MATPGQGAKVARAEQVASDEVAQKVWDRYHQVDGPPMRVIAAEVGVCDRTAWRYLASMQQRYVKERSEQCNRALVDALSESARIRAHAVERLFEADTAADAKRWADIVAQRLEWETKIGGWAAPTRHQIEDTTLTPDDITTARQHATPEEVAQLRALMGQPVEQDRLLREILRRARLGGEV